MVESRGASLKSLIGPAVVLVLVVVADQVTKFWAESALALRQPIEVIGSLVQFTLVYNEGGAMGTNFGSSTYYLISSVLILLFIVYYLYANRQLPRVTYPLALIAAGAVGNIVDRLRIGRVVDFIDIDIPDILVLGYDLRRWWTFNIADAAISLSIVYLVISLFLHRHEAKEQLPEVAQDIRDDQAQSI